MKRFIRHFRSFHLGNDISLAIEIDEDIIKYGVAFCSLKDQFCRATGRKLALKRLASDGLSKYSGVIVVNHKYDRVLAKVLSDIYSTGCYPDSADLPLRYVIEENIIGG